MKYFYFVSFILFLYRTGKMDGDAVVDTLNIIASIASLGLMISYC
jgi:hypothetical protein